MIFFQVDQNFSQLSKASEISNSVYKLSRNVSKNQTFPRMVLSLVIIGSVENFAKCCVNRDMTYNLGRALSICLYAVIVVSGCQPGLFPFQTAQVSMLNQSLWKKLEIFENIIYNMYLTLTLTAN